MLNLIETLVTLDRDLFPPLCRAYHGSLHVAVIRAQIRNRVQDHRVACQPLLGNTGNQTRARTRMVGTWSAGTHPKLQRSNPPVLSTQLGALWRRTKPCHVGALCSLSRVHTITFKTNHATYLDRCQYVGIERQPVCTCGCFFLRDKLGLFEIAKYGKRFVNRPCMRTALAWHEPWGCSR